MPSPSELERYYASYPPSALVSDLTLKRYDEILEKLAPYRRTNRLIDVGCGGGWFLQRAALAGWEVHGTEFGKRCYDLCVEKGIRMKEGALDPDQYDAGSFDVVTSFEVIEHLPDPLEEVRRMVRLLRPGGVIYMTTPNFRCVTRLISLGKWNVVNYPEHLCYFTPRTMHRMMERAGLERLQVLTTGISMSRLITSLRPAPPEGGKDLATHDEKLRNALEGRRALRSAKAMANGLLDLFKVGDSMKVLYRLPDQ